MDDEKFLGTRQKALQINLSKRVYGSFAEIGAGQEVAAIFFKAGGASGTIAKTMSAYDMTFSNAIYGEEESGRYVCESRLMKMLNKEYSLLEIRLAEKRGADTTFFAFANTVVALNYQKTNEGHGWIGVRFQLRPQSQPNDAIIHVRMHDNDSLLQQQALGIIGVNLLYGCYYYNQNPELLLKSLMDNLTRERIEVDMIRITGPDFTHIDNRLLSLQLVKNGLTEAALFGPDGNMMQPSEALYKKHVLALRGRFRPLTHVNMDMLKTGHEQFMREQGVDPKKVMPIAELTLHDLKAAAAEIDEKDFLDRVDILCSLGQTVMISNYHEYHKLVAYLSKLTKEKVGVILGIFNLESIFNEKYYESLKGGILQAFSLLFTKNVKLYVYPYRQPDGEMYNSTNFKVSEQQEFLYKYLLANNRIADIEGYQEDIMHIISDHVLAKIKAGEDGWEVMVPSIVSQKIKDNCLFGYPCEIKYTPVSEMANKENKKEATE